MNTASRSILVLCISGSLMATAYANHPVLVEGEQDYDGDGLIGPAEDTDNATDRVFGTLTAALAMANGAANQNGRVSIVTSGRFHEVVTITGANGNVTLEAAPGVEANIDAVGTGTRAADFPSDNATRQGQNGVIVNAPSTRHITLRNLVIRNWLEGVEVRGDSRVLIDNCRVEQNVNYGIHVSDSARVAVVNSRVAGTGFRVGAVGNFPAVNTPSPGIGIEFEDSTSGAVADTAVSGSFGAGLANSAAGANAVAARGLVLFDNNPDQSGPVKPLKPPF